MTRDRYKEGMTLDKRHTLRTYDISHTAVNSLKSYEIGGVPMETRELIDQAAFRQGLSHAKLAKQVNITPASLSNLRTGKGELSDDVYIKLAKLAGIDPAQVLIEKHLKKAGPEAAPLWQRISQVMHKSAGMMVFAVVVTPALLPHFDKFFNGLCLLC